MVYFQEGTNEYTYLCVYEMECYSDIKRDEILPFAKYTDGSRGYYAKRDKSDRER